MSNIAFRIAPLRFKTNDHVWVNIAAHCAASTCGRVRQSLRQSPAANKGAVFASRIIKGFIPANSGAMRESKFAKGPSAFLVPVSPPMRLRENNRYFAFFNGTLRRFNIRLF
jgi:hypothetical protein